ncbi:MAG: hypothetical protein FWE11_04195 [Defluviitaleaceae bacterium]|nr:hypothetical protein [Defluviitaleaceae bacterium]
MRRIKRFFIAILLLVVLVVPMTAPAFADEGIWLEIQRLQEENARLREQIRELEEGQRVQEPLVHLITPQNIVVEPGEVLEVNITIRNIGSHTAHSFLSTAIVNADAPFVVEFLNNSNRINSLNQNSQRDMVMRITVDGNASPGDTGTITLTHRYNNQHGAPVTSTDTISVRVAGEAGASNVRLSNFHVSESNLGPDQEFVVSATLQNLGTAPANNVQVSIANLDPDEIILISDLNNAFFSTLEPGQSTNVSFTFRTSRNISSNTYPINFQLTYQGVAANRPVTPFFVNVFADYTTVSPNLELRELSAPTGRLNVGQTGRITFELVNTGDAIAHNITVSASPMNEANLVPTTTNRQVVQSLGVGDTRTFEFGFMPTVNAGTHNHPVQLRVEYEIRGAGGAPSPFVQYVGLNVYNPEEEEPDDEVTGRLIPRIIVSTYTLEPQIPRAGQNFDMEITFVNTSGTQSVNNIRIVLEAPVAATTGTGTATQSGAVFTPAGGSSNTLFIPSMAPGESITRSVTMFTVPDAAPRMYALEVRLDYQDEDFGLHETTELLSIPVAQYARIETQPPELSIMPFMDMSGFVDFEFRILNTGRVGLHNLRVRVDGNFDTSQANDFMGPLAVGRANTFRGRIFPMEPGFQEGQIVIYGEDDAGEIVELVHPFSIEVMGFEGGGGYEGERSFEGEGEFFEGGGDRFPGGPMGDGDFFFGDDFYGDDEGGIFSRMLGFVRRPIVFVPAICVIVGAGVVVFIIINRKRTQLSFDD